jgi:Na+/H+ antiporter NhaC
MWLLYIMFSVLMIGMCISAFVQLCDHYGFKDPLESFLAKFLEKKDN